MFTPFSQIKIWKLMERIEPTHLKYLSKGGQKEMYKRKLYYTHRCNICMK